MKLPTLVLAALALPLLSACNTVPPTPSASAPPEAAWVGEARSISAAVPPKLLAVLTDAIQKSGPAGALDVCKDEAPQMARAASEKTGWQIKRVSLKNRNPKAVPDAWEAKTLESFHASQVAGADPQKLERFEIVTENGQQVRRYMKALPTNAFCLQCHGSTEKLGPGVAQRLTQLYPDDRAIGYAEGQIRGAITLRQIVTASPH
ncbi:MAG: DUF3365 domain-containing protein [Burkholderiaceae bacterium]|nr:DUF3365 domain-containing protein [Burkholderiaceae bacterium]